MKRKLLIAAWMLFLVTISLSAQDLTGTWVINNTVVKQTIDGITNTRSYAANDQTDCYVICPRKIVFVNQQATFELRDGSQESGGYQLQGNQLMWEIPAARYTYQCKLQGGIIQLDYEIEYVIDGVRKAKEQCTFYGTPEL